MVEQLNPNELAIIRTICAAGGEYVSLFQLAIELDLRYESCWTCVLRLTCRGLLVASRGKGRGRGYRLSLPCKSIKPRCPCKVSETAKPAEAIYG